MTTPSLPNVVFVLTDDQGYPPIGAHGHPFIQTPNLDSFHEKAVRFENFHSGTTCAPTRSGLMTGNYCNSTGVWHTIGGRSLLRAGEWTLANALSEAGYQTGLFGKWHLGDSYPYRAEDRGFQTVVRHGGGGISQGEDWWGNDYFDDTYYVNGEPRPFKGYCTDVFFREAETFIEENRDRPFFAFISTNAPHSPYNVESKYSDPYKEHTDNDNYARFLGMISNIDENFGHLRAKLAQLGLEENTILIFMSDNGQCGGAASRVPDAFNAGMRGFKGSQYEGGHRIPFLLRWPQGGLDCGQEIRTLTAYIDFMPTILDLCGISPDGKSMHGSSLVPLLKEGETTSWKERILVTDTQRVPHPVKWLRSCVMQDNWRLIDRDELYDLSSDPSQTRDIADENQDLVSSLRAEYERWWDLCSRQFDEDVPVQIGAEEQEVAELRTHDLRNEDCDVVWNQQQIRQGQTCLGYWEVEAVKAGRYEFELRRWPEEAGHAIAAGIDGDDVEFRRDAIASKNWSYYTGGKALPIRTACLAIENLGQWAVPVTDEPAAKLVVDLEPGAFHLRAFFSDNKGFMTSPYFVYIRRLGD